MEQQLLHFCDSKHPLVSALFRGFTCCGCQESIDGPGYWCRRAGCPVYGKVLHKSCAELPLGLHHPLHPIHPLILSPEQIDYGKDIQFSNCKLCNESRNQYTYRCSRCDFNLHITCASVLPTLEAEAELHDHPLIPIWKWITFTCDLCGKEDKESKLCVTSTSSTSPILLLNSTNPTPDFANSVFKNWTHAMGFTIALNAILLPILIVLYSRKTGRI
ncbi:uncharacterized protein LOC126717046 [Quercus robur]|uniref:uncharacterized protein LOC126717046 n=1 Tax=Quercus robur TaxID=38942 RepID=UPI002163FC83|nr:uncharacterized protein LOC126717046 [Quercus robur]